MSDIKANEEIKRNNRATEFDETRDTYRAPVGVAEKPANDAVNLTEEEAYWKEKYKTRAYYSEGRLYDDYAAAFHYGWEIAAKPENAGRKFEDIEPELERDWPSNRDSNGNAWQDVKDAVRDAYERIRGPK